MNKSLALVRVADGVAHATAPVNLNGDLLRAHMVEPLGEQAQLAALTVNLEQADDLADVPSVR